MRYKTVTETKRHFISRQQFGKFKAKISTYMRTTRRGPGEIIRIEE